MISLASSLLAVSLSTCNGDGLSLEILGSGGPEIDDDRISTSYLLWSGGKSVALFDLGSGSAQAFEAAGGDFNQLEAIFLTHLHVDHAADLPPLIKGSYFLDRKADLPVFGPAGNDRMPSVVGYVNALFGDAGAFRYLGNYLGTDRASDDQENYLIRPAIANDPEMLHQHLDEKSIVVEAAEVTHGPIPALAYAISAHGATIVISGDMRSGSERFSTLLNGADVFVAHHAIPEGAPEAARNLHMVPSEIGQMAAAADVGQVVLSHRMSRTLGVEDATRNAIGQAYSGKVTFAEDGTCINLRY